MRLVTGQRLQAFQVSRGLGGDYAQPLVEYDGVAVAASPLVEVTLGGAQPHDVQWAVGYIPETNEGHIGRGAFVGADGCENWVGSAGAIGVGADTGDRRGEDEDARGDGVWEAERRHSGGEARSAVACVTCC